jgi:hypothetical protein
MDSCGHGLPGLDGILAIVAFAFANVAEHKFLKRPFPAKHQIGEKSLKIAHSPTKPGDYLNPLCFLNIPQNCSHISVSPGM